QMLVEAINEREIGYKQIIRVMAEAGASMAQTGTEHGEDLRKIANQVEAAAKVDSILEMRHRLGRHVEELRVAAARAQREGEEKAKNLRQDLAMRASACRPPTCSPKPIRSPAWATAAAPRRRCRRRSR